MGSPHHVSRCPSHLLSCDQASVEFQAISLIAESLAHPQRAILSAFVQQAVDSELAARFFLDDVIGDNKATIAEFLADWISLLRRVRPKTWTRHSDGAYGEEMKANAGRLYAMLAVYLGRSKLESLESLLHRDPESPSYDPSGQLMLLSSQMLAHFANGRLSLKADPLGTTCNSAQYFVKVNIFIPFVRADIFPFKIRLENRAIDSSSLPEPRLIETRHRFAIALAWLEVSDYMKQSRSSSYSSTSHDRTSLAGKVPTERSWIRRCIQPFYRIIQHLWLNMPVFLRATAYECLASLGKQFYGGTGSDQTHRLPFNLYLRKARQEWASRHQAELQSLQIVNKYTHIPAPKGVDAIQHRGSSYLLMTGLHGCGIGQRISTMTDKQLETAAQDLKAYELRRIPNETGSRFCICNSLGGGILDWRIGDSQRKQLRFHTETEFNQHLTDDLPLDEDAWRQISKSHGVKHDIVFTHADLNLRNILVDEMGRISGIVDWECAGWYPEYWEHSKMHFTVRCTPRWTADVVDQIFPAYRNELHVENMLSSMAPSW